MKSNKKLNTKEIMKVIMIIAVIIIPVLYSYFYLKAFWDPYNSLHDIKVAIVNLDSGNGTENLGNELVNKLKDNNKMTYVIMNDSDKAQEGLINQDYYATITIPKDFTENLNSGDSTNKKETTITYSPNQKDNYLASQIINKVVSTMESDLDSEVSKKVVGKLSDNLNEVPDKMQTISDGAQSIQNGTSDLQNGISTLNQGTNKLNKNYSTFDNGITTAYNGSQSLSDGLNQLSNGINSASDGTAKLVDSTKDISKLTDGSSKVKQGSIDLSGGVNQYVSGVNQLLSGVQTSQTDTKSALTSIGTSLTKYAASNPSAMSDPNFQSVLQTLNGIQKNDNSSKLSSSITTLQKSGNELKAGATTLKDGAASLNEGTTKLADLSNGLQTLNNGMTQLKTGVSQLQAGNKNLETGLYTLSTNSKTIASGISSLNNGTQSAVDGTSKLQNGVTTFKSSIDNGILDTKSSLTKLNGLDSYVQNPVNIDEEDYAPVSSYGTGFAPYFMSLSLWVGSLIMLIIFYYDPDDGFKILGRNTKHKFLRMILYFVIASLQGIVLGYLLKMGLALNITNIYLYYGACILTALAFCSIIQFLILNLGNIGKFLGILLLVLQLAASAGTFPIETVPKGFQAIYPFVPMNYTIKLIKEAIIKIDPQLIMKNVVVLSLTFIVFTSLTVICDIIRTKKEKHDTENT